MGLRFPPGTYVVTGAASGIGLATAALLGQEGLRVHMVDVDESRLADEAARLAAAGLDVGSSALDLTSRSAVLALASALESSRVRGVAHVAGRFQSGPLSTVSTEDWERLIDLNLTASFLLCKAFIPLIESAGGGAVVLTSSMTGRTKSMNVSANYIASKAGVIGLTMALGAQHARFGVRVNCVAPGKVDTPLFRSVQSASVDHGADVPMGRVGQASEVADVIAFLLSDNSSYVTGETVNVNGGMFTV